MMVEPGGVPASLNAQLFYLYISTTALLLLSAYFLADALRRLSI
jgi:hypothetical protein